MRTALASLLLAACAGGCLSMPTWWEKPKAAPAAPIAAKPARPRPNVSAEQITESNAREMAGALLDELDHDAQAESLPPAEKATRDAKSEVRSQTSEVRGQTSEVVTPDF